MSKDCWCTPLKRRGKKTLYGGAARNVRIAACGGMDNIIADAVLGAFEKANRLSGGNVVELQTRIQKRA